MMKYTRLDVMPIVQSVIGVTDELNEDVLLRNHGLDSMAIINLFSNLEAHFKVMFLNEDLTSENFQSIRNILRILERARSA
ncbi:phosphopantetheine-binding protein [Pseudochelatococcus sp. G4_1912]|uniref:phosphopantetheine-binding protein n=1 Tax=Pseudochelatococcus sp. G4_1912 TaxID=3114288 RepID=UPI0039C75D8F